ncbi:MAG: peptidase S41, partial [Bacteroidales bacterium]|nr:peptidase S41 [Bacteroidales bacterium]
GGIMPDIFVPWDTSYYSDFYRDMVRKGLINRFVLNHVDENRSKFGEEYTNFEKFDKGFQVDKSLVGKFYKFTEKEGLKPKESDINKSEEQIKILIKALVARDLFGSSEFYQVINGSEEIYQKALEVMGNWKEFYSEVFQHHN